MNILIKCLIVRNKLLDLNTTGKIKEIINRSESKKYVAILLRRVPPFSYVLFSIKQFKLIKNELFN